jgi:hypothetical protein
MYCVSGYTSTSCGLYRYCSLVPSDVATEAFLCCYVDDSYLGWKRWVVVVKAHDSFHVYYPDFGLARRTCQQAGLGLEDISSSQGCE